MTLKGTIGCQLAEGIYMGVWVFFTSLCSYTVRLVGMRLKNYNFNPWWVIWIHSSSAKKSFHPFLFDLEIGMVALRILNSLGVFHPIQIPMPTWNILCGCLSWSKWIWTLDCQRMVGAFALRGVRFFSIEVNHRLCRQPVVVLFTSETRIARSPKSHGALLRSKINVWSSTPLLPIALTSSPQQG